MQTLGPPLTGSDDASRVLAGAIWSLLDAYDRKLLREKFEEIVDSSIRITQLLARYGLSQIMVQMHENGHLTPEKLAEASKDLMERAEKERQKLLNKMKLVVQCPGGEDPIH